MYVGCHLLGDLTAEVIAGRTTFIILFVTWETTSTLA